VNKAETSRNRKNQKGEENGSAKKASLGAAFGNNITPEQLATMGG
jgi:hypothetical protein